MNAETDFDMLMQGLHRRTGLATGYWPNYFRRQVLKDGGVHAAKRLLDPRRRVSTGFDRLVEARRADLSIEFIALKPEFHHLFTRGELEEARRRLDNVPPDGFPQDVNRDRAHPDELPGRGSAYAEGSRLRVTVNAWERSAKARDACLRCHGAHCAVCGFEFLEHYGELGAGFMHVHHVKPLALSRKKYRVNPKTDLVPVCPNCHAMLHRKSPPLDVEELRRLVRDRQESV